MKSQLRLIFGCALALTTSSARAQTAAVTDPVGFVNVSVPAQSDVAIGAPVHRAAVYQGRIRTVGNGSLTVVGEPGWTADAFKFVAGSQTTTYFVRLDSGVKEGMWSTITGNTSDSLTIDLAGENHSGVKSDDEDGQEAGDHRGRAFHRGTDGHDHGAGTATELTEVGVARLSVTTYRPSGRSCTFTPSTGSSTRTFGASATCTRTSPSERMRS